VRDAGDIYFSTRFQRDLQNVKRGNLLFLHGQKRDSDLHQVLLVSNEMKH
jgi:hypothetical protein